MASTAPVILVIEDEVRFRQTLKTSLKAQGYLVVEAGTAREGLAQASGRNPDLILLDLGLPDADGLEVTRKIRRWTGTPIIVLSARGQEQDKVEALDLGADDYLTKPFGVPELGARIRVALRHASLPAGGKEAEAFECGPLRVDLLRRQVFRAGDEVHLTPTEYKLLALLIRYPGRVLTHSQLLQGLWGANRENQRHHLRVHMAQLRHKLEPDPARPSLITTEPGVGYRLRDQS